MKTKKWSQWIDVGIRTDHRGYHYLLQYKSRHSDNKKVFRNRSIDGRLLIHGFQVMDKLKEFLKLN